MNVSTDCTGSIYKVMRTLSSTNSTCSIYVIMGMIRIYCSTFAFTVCIFMSMSTDCTSSIHKVMCTLSSTNSTCPIYVIMLMCSMRLQFDLHLENAFPCACRKTLCTDQVIILLMIICNFCRTPMKFIMCYICHNIIFRIFRCLVFHIKVNVFCISNPVNRCYINTLISINIT